MYTSTEVGPSQTNCICQFHCFPYTQRPKQDNIITKIFCNVFQQRVNNFIQTCKGILPKYIVRDQPGTSNKPALLSKSKSRLYRYIMNITRQITMRSQPNYIEVQLFFEMLLWFSLFFWLLILGLHMANKSLIGTY